VLLKTDHSLPIVSVNLAFYGGMREEPAGLSGLAQITAQLWGKGTQAMNALELAQAVESRGARFSTVSTFDDFRFHLDLLSRDVDFGLALLWDLLASPGFEESEFNRIKAQMATSILARDDSISQMAVMRLKKELFAGHPFQFDPLGDQDTVAKIQLADVKRLAAEFLAPDKMVLTVYGDIDPDKTLAAIKEKFSRLKPKKVYKKIAPIAARQKYSEQSFTMDKKQSMVIVGFQAVSITDPDRYAMEVLKTILGSPFKGRIFNTIRDQMGLAYTLGGGFAPFGDSGMIYFYALTSPENSGAVKAKLLQLIADLGEQGVPADELLDIQKYMQGTFAMSLQTNSALAAKCMIDELDDLGYDNYRLYSQNIAAVTAGDIQRLAQKYLALDKAVVVVANPGAVPAGADKK